MKLIKNVFGTFVDLLNQAGHGGLIQLCSEDEKRHLYGGHPEGIITGVNGRFFLNGKEVGRYTDTEDFFYNVDNNGVVHMEFTNDKGVSTIKVGDEVLWEGAGLLDWNYHPDGIIIEHEDKLQLVNKKGEKTVLLGVHSPADWQSSPNGTIAIRNGDTLLINGDKIAYEGDFSAFCIINNDHFVVQVDYELYLDGVEKLNLDDIGGGYNIKTFGCHPNGLLVETDDGAIYLVVLKK